MGFNELHETLQLRLSGEFKRFADEELRTVLTLLAGPGVVWELAFSSWVPLQPERINAYARALNQTPDSPAGRKTIAQRFNAGFRRKKGERVPSGTKECVRRAA